MWASKAWSKINTRLNQRKLELAVVAAGGILIGLGLLSHSINGAGSPTAPSAVLGSAAEAEADTADLSRLLSNWDTGSQASDLNYDGVVDTADLSVLLSEWAD